MASDDLFEVRWQLAKFRIKNSLLVPIHQDLEHDFVRVIYRFVENEGSREEWDRFPEGSGGRERDGVGLAF